MTIITDKMWLDAATKFELGECIFHNRQVIIEQRKQMYGEPKWVVIMDNWVMNKKGKFIYEPMPSSRTDKFIKSTRFDTKEDAYAHWVELVKEKQNLTT